MRAMVFAAVMLLALYHVGLATCSGTISGGGKVAEKTLTLSLPVKLIVKLVKKVIPGIGAVEVEPKVTLEFQAGMEFELLCGCEPCCRDPEKQVASLTVSSSIRAFGGTVEFAGAKSRVCPGEAAPAQNVTCGCPVEIAYEAGRQVPALGVGISLEGVSYKSQEAEMRFTAASECACSTDTTCFGNTAPQIVEVSPPVLQLKKQGQSGLITVTAMDREGNLDHFSSKTKGPGYLTAVLVSGPEWQERDGKRFFGRATYRVDFPEGGEELRSFAIVSVVDACRQADDKKVPVQLFYPPHLTLQEGEWRRNRYIQEFEVSDPDFKGCGFDR